MCSRLRVFPLQPLAVLEVREGHLHVCRRALGLVRHLDRDSFALQRARARVEPTAPLLGALCSERPGRRD